MSKLAIAVAMPWNLSISVDSILLKNLVLIRLGVVGASPFEKSEKRIRELFASAEAPEIAYTIQESTRIYRVRSAFLMVCS